MQRLDNFLSKPDEKMEKTESEESLEEKDAYSGELGIPKDLEFYLLGIGYDGDKGLAYAKLYDVGNDKISFWYDNTDHRPY